MPLVQPAEAYRADLIHLVLGDHRRLRVVAAVLSAAHGHRKDGGKQNGHHGEYDQRQGNFDQCKSGSTAPGERMMRPHGTPRKGNLNKETQVER